MGWDHLAALDLPADALSEEHQGLVMVRLSIVPWSNHQKSISWHDQPLGHFSAN